MKYILVLAFIVTASFYVFSQTPQKENSPKPSSDLLKIGYEKIVKTKPVSQVSDSYSDRSLACATDSFTIDYATAGKDSFFSIWRVNDNYTSTDNGTLKYIVVAFHDLWDTKNAKSHPYNDGSVTIDSIFYEFGHENLSGQTNTLITKIIALDGNDFPTDDVLWVDSLKTTKSLTTGSWVFTKMRGISVKLRLPIGTKFGVRIEYIGPTNDRLGIRCGYRHVCPKYCGSELSLFYPNSFYYYNGTGVTGFWPTAGGGQLYYDCDTNGIITIDSCERIILQDFVVHAKVSLNKLGVDAGADKTLCEGESYTMMPTVQGKNPPYSYAWGPTQGLADPNKLITFANPTTTTTYSLSVTDNANCLQTDEMTITVNPAPVIKLGWGVDTTNVCYGCTLTLDAGNPGANYIWSTGATTQTIDVSTVGQYWVNVSLNGCVAYAETYIIFSGIDDPVEGSVQNLLISNNPGGDNIIVSYNLLKRSNLIIEIYDLLGERVFQINRTNVGVGAQKEEISLNAGLVSKGIYFVRLTTDDAVQTRKFVIVR